MKKQVYIAMVALAAIMLMVVPLIPHHHHAHVLCMVVEHCESDNADNDVHTHHNDDGTACVEQGSLLVSKANAYGSTIHKLQPSFVFFILWKTDVELLPTFRLPMEWGEVAPNHPALLNLSCALRAPPAVSC